MSEENILDFCHLCILKMYVFPHINIYKTQKDKCLDNIRVPVRHVIERRKEEKGMNGIINIEKRK